MLRYWIIRRKVQSFKLNVKLKSLKLNVKILDYKMESTNINAKC